VRREGEGHGAAYSEKKERTKGKLLSSGKSITPWGLQKEERNHSCGEGDAGRGNGREKSEGPATNDGKKINLNMGVG